MKLQKYEFYAFFIVTTFRKGFLDTMKGIIINSHNISHQMKTTSFHYLWVSVVMATLTMLCPLSICATGATSQEINNAIVLEESIPLIWENDTQYPFYIENGKAKSGNAGISNSKSSISFYYNSQHISDISLKYQNNNYNTSSHFVGVYIDGVLAYESNSSQSVNNLSFRLPIGNHIISVRDSIGNNTSNSYYTILWDVKVTEAIGANSDELNNAILTDGSIALNWVNDSQNPWMLSDGYAKSNNFGFANSKSALKFSYVSETTSNVSFKYQNNDYNNNVHYVEVFIDGECKYESNVSQYVRSESFFMPSGHHEVVFRDSLGNNSGFNYFMKLWDVCVNNYPKIEDIIVSPNSIPIEIRDEGLQPWYIEDGAAKSSSYKYNNSSSILKSKITLDKRTKVSFNTKVGYRYPGDSELKFSINEEPFYISPNSNWNYVSVVLHPGTYDLKWVFSNTYSGNDYYALIKDISLTQDWIDVAVTPGMLGVETLYKVNVLTDVELLSVSGSLNDADWTTIKMMKNLHALDLSATDIQSIQDEAFKNLPYLNTVYLPENVKTIGNEAFIGTNLNFITIPSSVQSIGRGAFSGTPLHKISFNENSDLESIGYEAFKDCKWLQEFIMPNSVVELETYSSSSNDSRTFYDCSALNKIVFSDKLTILPDYTCYNNRAVTELHLPINVVTIGDFFMYAANGLKSLEFPETLRSIGRNAFSGIHQIENLSLPDKLNTIGYQAFEKSENLKVVELPSGVTSYDLTFSGCNAIETVICRSATPPTISYDPFPSITKANVTLKVPSFSVPSYKLDSYWYQFGNIIEGDPVDYWKIIGDLKLLNNRRMEGKPDIDLYYGGKLTIGGDAPMEVGKLDIYISEESPSSLVSDCNAFTADEINTIFKVDPNKWYFITPMADIDLRQVNVSGSANYVFRYYDGATRADIGAGTSWKNVSSMTLKAGLGYIFQCNAASDITFPVPVEFRSKILSTDPVKLTLSAHPSDNAANKGWNYLGNPYPSYYDIHYMDFTAPITVWTGSTYRAYSIADDNYVLRPMQGFFVQKPDAVDAITLQVAGRQIESTVNRSYATKVKSRVNSEGTRAIFNLEIGGEEPADMTRVVFNENADLGYEIERDASKFMSMDDSVAQIYTIDDVDNKLAINERPANDGIVNLGIYLPNSNDEYIISASKMDGNAILLDKENNTEHDLSNGGYKFTSMSAGVCEDRFALKLKSSITSGISTISAGNVLVETVTDGIIVKGSEKIFVYSTDGIQIYHNDSVNGDIHIMLAKGIYVVVANGKSYKVAVK